jgi:hypothetical protein
MYVPNPHPHTTSICTHTQRKIKKAFCPPEVVEGNPVVDYVKHIVFGYYGKMEVAFQVRCEPLIGSNRRVLSGVGCRVRWLPRLFVFFSHLDLDSLGVQGKGRSLLPAMSCEAARLGLP